MPGPEQLFINFCITVTFAFFRSLTFVTLKQADTVVPPVWRGVLTVIHALALSSFPLAVGGTDVDLSAAPLAALTFSNGLSAALLSALPIIGFHVLRADPVLPYEALMLLLTIVMVMVIRKFRRERGPPTLLEGLRNSLVLFAGASVPLFLLALAEGEGLQNVALIYFTQVIGNAVVLVVITWVMRSHFQVVGKSERYQALAQLDALTQLYNRRKFDEDLSHFTQATHILLLDLDHFKYVNDTYGHEMGDEVLKVTAQVVQETMRESDRVYRLGGEEFAVLLSSCLPEAAQGVAERVRSNIESRVGARTGLNTPVTVSGGLVEVNGDPRTIMRAADALLYTAKNSGRNRIVLQPAVDLTSAGPGNLTGGGPP
ncbi:diguanylate cyclase (plasmid) [Deinococcus taeanensis]|uniref:GGDEF domain-containing protein n=1 Tax=Deinococcus taeanensis TaxID=2737050 RepID=UPI001CDD01ED|nr:diguanylate cyclase [Deinococcus taeanensis]UBV45314.1 diguanylate cyclase [Deinococcus taeanensis]